MRDGRLVRHCASTVEARDDLSLTKTGAPVTLCLPRSSKWIFDYEDPTRLSILPLLFSSHNFYYSLSLSRNFERRRKFTESPTYPSSYFMDHSFSNFFFIFVSFCENPEKNSRLTRYRSIKGLRHAPSPPSSPITITRSKTRISLKSLRIVRRVGREEGGKV